MMFRCSLARLAVVSWVAVFAIVGAAAAPSLAAAQPDVAPQPVPASPPAFAMPRGAQEMPDSLRRILANEPTPSQVLEATDKFLELEPNKIKRIRKRARRRALLPLFAIGGKVNRIDFQMDRDQLPQNFHTDEEYSTTDQAANVGVLWDLRDLAFNAAELDVYSIIEMRRRVLTEVSRVYLARRLLQIDLYTEDNDLRTRLSLEARIAEYTAVLDSVTGGWFDEKLGAAGMSASNPIQVFIKFPMNNLPQTTEPTTTASATPVVGPAKLPLVPASRSGVWSARQPSPRGQTRFASEPES